MPVPASVTGPSATLFELMCIYCSAVCMDWQSLFDHVIDCPVRHAPAPQTISSPTSGTGESVYHSATSSAESGRRRLPPGSGRHRCVCGLSYTEAFNLQRHQRLKGCLTQTSETAVSQSAATAAAVEPVVRQSNGPFVCPYAECGKEIVFERNYRSHLLFHEEQELKRSLRNSQSRTRRADHSLLPSIPDNDSNQIREPTSGETTFAAPDFQIEVEL